MWLLCSLSTANSSTAEESFSRDEFLKWKEEIQERFESQSLQIEAQNQQIKEQQREIEALKKIVRKQQV